MKRILLLIASVAGILFLVVMLLRRDGSPSSADHQAPDRASSTESEVVEPSRPSDLGMREPVTPTSASGDPAVAVAAGSEPTVFAHVVDEADQPVADASITLIFQGQITKHTSGKDGRCPLPLEVVLPSVLVEFKVEADGFVPWRGQAWIAPDIRLPIDRAIVVHGRVVDADSGVGIANATLRCATLSSQIERAPSFTDTAGNFELDDVPEAPRGDGATWVISAPNYVATRAEVHYRGNSKPITIELPRGIALTLDVVDGISGAAVGGASLQFGEDLLTTDALGRATVFAPPEPNEKPTQFSVSADDYCFLRGQVRASDADAERSIRVPLVPSSRLVGRVLDEHGAAVGTAHVHVALNLQKERSSRDERETRVRSIVPVPIGWGIESRLGLAGSLGDPVSPDGEFRFDGLLPWSDSYELGVVAEGSDNLRVSVLPLGAPGSVTTMDVTLPSRGPVGIVAGTVTLNGKPSGAQILWTGPTRNGSAFANADGEFELGDVEVGAVTLVTTPSGLNSFLSDACRGGASQTTTLAVVAGKNAALNIDVAYPLAKIRGRVTNPDGSAAVGAGIWADAKAACWRQGGTTDADGRFDLDVDASVAEFEVRAGRGANFAKVSHIAPGSDDVHLVLPGVAHVRLRVRDADTHEPIRHARAVFWRSGLPLLQLDSGISNPESFRCDSDGWFPIEASPGHWDVLVSDGFGNRTDYVVLVAAAIDVPPDPIGASIDIMRGQAVDVQIALAPGQEAWPNGYKVLLLEPEFVDEVEYSGREWTLGTRARSINVLETRAVKLGVDGRALVRRVGKGKLSVRVFPPGITITPSEIVVPTADGHPIELTWRTN